MSPRIPLVRVEGKRFQVRPDQTMTAERFAKAQPLSIEARDRVAREAEVEFEFSPSLYFYAGVAHPDFGDIVLAYDPESLTNLDGAMSTFDTGGMYLGLIKGNFDEKSSEARKQIVAADQRPFEGWRGRVAQWILDWFETTDSYIDGVPKSGVAEPTGRVGHPANERRAWTCEIRIHGDLPLFDALAFAVIHPNLWNDALNNANEFDRARLLDLLADGKIIFAESPESHPCSVAAEYIKRYILSGASS